MLRYASKRKGGGGGGGGEEKRKESKEEARDELIFCRLKTICSAMMRFSLLLKSSHLWKDWTSMAGGSQLKE